MIIHDIDLAATILQQNEIIAIPTETVYGLAGNAFNDTAIEKIYTCKNRPRNNPLIIHIHSIQQLDQVACEIPDWVYTITDRFWPGPLTLILKKQASISMQVTAGLDTVAVRMPNHHLTLELLKKLPFPLVAPSANPFTRISPTNAEHVNMYFQNKIVVLDGGTCSLGLESSIIHPEGDTISIYRHGAITADMLRFTQKEIIVKTSDHKTPLAPGMFLKHYAPQTQTLLTDNIQKAIAQYPDTNIAVLSFTECKLHHSKIYFDCLSPKKDLYEAAKNLYSKLLFLDSLDKELLIIERVPNEGIGLAINERLEKAASIKL